jgi:hypothetical protein
MAVCGTPTYRMAAFYPMTQGIVKTTGSRTGRDHLRNKQSLIVQMTTGAFGKI